MGLVEKTFKRGEIIIKEGDIGKSFFQLLDGRVGVYADYDKKEPFRFAVLEAGEYFGEMAIIEEYPRSATVVAESNATVIEITEDQLNAYLSEDTDRIYKLMYHLGTRVNTMLKDYNDAKVLLKEAKDSDAAKKKSLFSKLKKHIDLYQANKNKIPEMTTESLREAVKNLSIEPGETKVYSKGMMVFKEGEVGESMYVLHEGTIGMYSNYRRKDELKTDEISAVAFFGEIGMIVGEPREVSAVAETSSTLVETIHQEDLETIFRACPAKIDLILRHLSYTLRKLNIEFLTTCKEITETYNS